MDNSATNLSGIEIDELGSISPSPITKPRLLIVEDDQAMRDLYFHLFNDDYDLSFAEDGKSGLALYTKFNPEIVLLDIGLPDQSGLSVCQQMRANTDNLSSIMCVSGYDQDEDMLKAYKVGADDYTAKPFNPSVLLAKVESLVQFQQQRAELVNDNKASEQVAFQSMLEASNYGEVIQFFKSTVAKENTNELINTFFSLMNSLQLSACIQIRSDETLTLRSPEAVCSPIEERLFSLLKNNGRIFSFNGRTLINDEHVSILIKKTPEDDVIKGRVNDILCVIIELMEEKIKDIERRQQLATARAKVTSIGNSLNNRLAVIEEGAAEKLDSASNLVAQLERGFDFFDLTQEQEEFFQTLLNQSRADLDTLQTCLSGLESELTELSFVLQD